ncbi:TPA: fimbrial protein [Escherichia coli]|uniref:fimbrial protein n=1 Tax=Escherichia coli TaxID=562 RepID=UPI000BF09D5D|nr:fimbrial protein [Escherichia coli]EEU9272428.1 fimbrial protein [Escherichia coli]EFB6893540.1 fimbrial protein [Escherichia coli]EFC6539164.1 fimbrial protein [Escherichia coli]EFH5317953.1 fimbrial protein [Escherichia coli]EFI3615808.1 fimbrial protein [Escherichia coli]
MKLKVIATLIATVAVGASFSNNPAYASTTSASLTVNSNLTMGTCSAQVLDSNNKATDTVALGNVYISEVAAKSKVQPFKIRFSDCAGLTGKKAQLVLAPNGIGMGCAGGSSNTAAFANSIAAGAGGSSRAAVEVWTTTTPEGNGSQQFSCVQRNVITVDLSNASTTQPYDYDLSARMVTADGRPATDVLPGEFRSPTTFTITYQ